MIYDTIYLHIFEFANYTVHGVLVCRLLAPVVLLILLWISRIVVSVIVKIFAVFFAIILYFLPSVVNIFVS